MSVTVYEWEQHWGNATLYQCQAVDFSHVNSTSSTFVGGDAQAARDLMPQAWNNAFPEDPKEQNDFTFIAGPPPPAEEPPGEGDDA